MSFLLAGLLLCSLSNGGFEEIGPNGLPVGWAVFWARGEMGRDVVAEVTDDAFEGGKAFRMKVTSKASLGLNRSYPAIGKGKPAPSLGDLLPVKKGGFTFRYKLIETTGDNVRFYVIPMGEDNFETAYRAIYVLPKLFAGDGRWHLGAIAFDYTDDPRVRSVQPAPRINEGGRPGPGEVIFDDIRYVERVGFHLRISDLRVVPSPDDPARGCVIEVEFENTGDSPAEPVVQLSSDSLKLTPLDLPRRIDPGKRGTLRWEGIGLRRPGTRLTLRWEASEGEEEELTFEMRPRIRLIGFGPGETVLRVGEAARLRLALANEGEAVSRPLSVRIELSDRVELLEGERSVRIESLPPGRREIVWAIRPVRPGLIPLRVEVSSPDLEKPLEASFTAVCSRQPGSDAPRIESGGLTLLFPENPFGYGVCEVRFKGERMGIIPYLAELRYLTDGGKGKVVWLYARRFKREGRGISFEASHRDEDGAVWRLSVGFIPDGDGYVRIDASLRADKPRKLLALHVPRLLVGEWGFGREYDEALLPGIYYMKYPETSLDIEFSDPPHNDQHAPHPYKITAPAMAVRRGDKAVGLMWDPLQKWDGENIAPSALFASPNWVDVTLKPENPVPENVLFQNDHLLGLFLPSIPGWVRENNEEAEKPYELGPGGELRLSCWLFGLETEEIPDVVLAYIDRFGLPSLPEKPRSYEETLRMCDLPLEPPKRFGRLIGLVSELEGQALDALEGQAPDGSWKFRMDPGNTSRLMRFAPHRKTLGPEGDSTLGTCTFQRRRAIALWRYARLTGNEAVLEKALKALDYIDRNFTRPEGAQTWEVPLHCPDILAAGYGVQLYLEAFKVTGERRYLERARYWARTGLPFVYLWEAPDRPTMMLFADIPVLGSSYYKVPWFGKPVQWCGLAYATDLQRLAYTLNELGEEEEAKFWRHIAEGMTICGMEMQIEEGPRRGNYPDSVSLTYQYKRNDPGIIRPHLIAQNIWMLTHPDLAVVDFFTRILKTSEGRIHISAESRIEEARLEGDVLRLRLVSPEGKTRIISQLIISPVAEPKSLRRNGKELPRRTGGEGEWWRYDRRNGMICVQIAHPSPEVELIVEGLRHRRLDRFPVPSKPDWGFDSEGDPEGWSPASDLTGFRVSGGVLRMRSTGGDPYIIGPPIRADAGRFSRFLVRMRVEPSEGEEALPGQIFWARSDSRGFSESKSAHFAIRADGRFHTYEVKLAGHPEWRGIITRLRLDPGNKPGLKVEIDWMRLE